MEFELSERITTVAGKKEIFSVLTSQFKKVSESVVQKENLVGVVRVGAFFDGFRNDTSIIRLKENDDGFLLTAEVNYRPSVWFWIVCIILTFTTFVGELIPLIIYFYQKNAVSKTIQNIFMRVKNEFQNTNNVKVPSNTTDLDKLEKLHNLKEKGIITEDEFNTKKKEILQN